MRTPRTVVLVTDGEQRATLAVVRSLGAAGCEVHVCSANAHSLAGGSRFARSEATVPDPLRNADAFRSAVRELGARTCADVLLPMSEASLLALLPARASMRALIPFPDIETFRRIHDKTAVAEAGARAGIAVPRQLRVAAPDQLPREVALAYPLVVKPGRSVVDDGTARTKTIVQYANGREELESILAGLPPGAFPVLLQERITGPGAGVFLLLWDDEVVASFCHRRIREKPPSGGVSVYRESIAPDGALIERSVALLRALEWQGVAMIEYKIDARTGVPYIMEINGRFWGSLQLAIDAGVEFPALLVERMQGRRAFGPASWRVGVRSRWFWGDVDHLLARLRHSRERLDLGADAPRRLRAIADFVTGFGGREEVFRFTDPVPAWRETVAWFRSLGRTTPKGVS